MRICISKTLEKSGHDDIAYTSSIQKFENGVNEVFSLLGTNFPMDSFQDTRVLPKTLNVLLPNMLLIIISIVCHQQI